MKVFLLHFCQIKTRIESWLKDAETDAEKADQYLGKKKEKLKELESRKSQKSFIISFCHAESISSCLPANLSTYFLSVYLSGFVSVYPSGFVYVCFAVYL